MVVTGGVALNVAGIPLSGAGGAAIVTVLTLSGLGLFVARRRLAAGRTGI
jgi:hypothetical protein